ncbi:MAG TPA: LysM peptidoglycan-binding domain-containing protein [Chroococcales cyanobacterium]
MERNRASGKKKLLRGLLAAALLLAFRTPAFSNEAPTYGRYQVQPGDTLRSISERLLGDPKRWKELYLLNEETIGEDPDRLKSESVLLIPLSDERIAELARRPLEPAPSPPPPLEGYLVKPGDTLIGIARRELGDPSLWRGIYQKNREKIGADPGVLKKGLSLSLPEKKEKAEKIEKIEKRCYQVKKGDTLLSIARSVLGDVTQWKKLYQDNRPAIGENPNVLKVGICLCLPDSPKARYVVKPGDTLLSIAGTVLGDRRRWHELHLLNEETIGADPNALRPGMELALP